MEFFLLIGICILGIIGVVWFARGRSTAADDAGLASQASAEAERRKNDWFGGTG